MKCDSAKKSAAAPAILLLALAASGCATPPPAAESGSPPAGCADRVLSRLYFGLGRKGGNINDGEWRQFVEDAVLSRFPAGLTIVPAEGYWRDGAGHPLREPSRVIEIAHDAARANAESIAQIVARYKARFQQESVLVVRLPVHACF